MNGKKIGETQKIKSAKREREGRGGIVKRRVKGKKRKGEGRGREMGEASSLSAKLKLVASRLLEGKHL